jgi:hypothetical protein
MVTLCTYWKPVEAALAKSILDNYDIFCALAHENANLYGGGPLAMPIRLLVDEDQTGRAICFLHGNVEAAAEIELRTRIAASGPEVDSSREIANANPWELLVIAFYYFLPGICALQTKYPTVIAENQLKTRREIAAVTVFHFLGWLGLVFAIALVAIYFYLSRSERSKS